MKEMSRIIKEFVDFVESRRLVSSFDAIASSDQYKELHRIAMSEDRNELDSVEYTVQIEGIDGEWHQDDDSGCYDSLDDAISDLSRQRDDYPVVNFRIARRPVGEWELADDTVPIEKDTECTKEGTK